MNDEQLLAWFILEGYQAWNWKDLDVRKTNPPYTIAKYGQLDGWVTNSAGDTYDYRVKPSREKPYPMSVVDRGVLRLTYRKITGEWP